MSGEKNKDSVVKIDGRLLEDVEDFINLAENNYRYVNKKQFVDIAVSEFLKKEKKRLKR